MAFAHARHRSAKHGLHRIIYQGVLDGHNELDEGHILLQPTPDAGVQVVEVLEHDCSLGFFVKRKNGVAAETLHRSAQLAARLAGHEVAMESLSAERSRDRAIRADQPQIKTELLGDGQGECMTTARDQDDFNTGIMGLAQSRKIVGRDLEMRIEQRAVDIGGDKLDGVGLRASAFGLRENRASGLSQRTAAI